MKSLINLIATTIRKNKPMPRLCPICFLFVALIFSTSTSTLAADKADDGWYPFVLAERMDPNSPANIGKLVLDAPAGKHGFLKVQDGHFVFEDGTPIRFWGTNLAMGACFPDKKQAEIMADRLAFFGFNAVRLHHMDWSFEPNGIFKDVDPAYKDPQMKRTGYLSETQLDRLDYLIYLLKQRGIYIDMNLLVSRHFTEADGLKEPNKFGIAAKPVSMFDPTLIKLQKKYAKDLLTHFNPYTQTRYADDPALALIEITNENSIMAAWENNQLNGSLLGFKKNFIPPFYTQQLDQKWNTWLKARYGAVDAIKKAWSLLPEISPQTNTPNIINQPVDNKLWDVAVLQGAQANLVTADTVSTIHVEKVTTTSWHIQFGRNDFNLFKNKSYLIKFTASAFKPIQIQLLSQQASAPWVNLGLSATIELANHPVNFEIPFTPAVDCPNAKIAFIVGSSMNKFIIKDIIIQEFPAGSLDKERNINSFTFARPLHKFLSVMPEQKRTDITDFYSELQGNYFVGMMTYLKSELGVKIPITGIGGISTNDDIKTENTVDFIDTHAYWDHPQFPHKPWDRNDFRINNTSMLKDPNLGMVGAIKGVRSNTPKIKPLTVTEWNHCYPNEYAYESPLLMAAEAVNEKWDGMFQFLFITKLSDFDSIKNINSFFDIFHNPQQLALVSVAAILQISQRTHLELLTINGVLRVNSPYVRAIVGIIKEKTFNFNNIIFNSNANGAVCIITVDHQPIENSRHMLVTIVSTTRNVNSGMNTARFNWGNAPSQLKQMTVKVDIRTSFVFKAFGLDQYGRRVKNIPTVYQNGVLQISNENEKSPWIELISQ